MILGLPVSGLLPETFHRFKIDPDFDPDLLSVLTHHVSIAVCASAHRAVKLLSALDGVVYLTPDLNVNECQANCS